MIQLASDAGAFQAGLKIGSAGTTQNSQCMLDAGASSVTASGTSLTLNLAITFEMAFSGAKNVYMHAQNAVGNSGWVQRGTWEVPRGTSPPFPVSVIPNNGNTSSTTLTFTFSDPNGVTDIVSTQININAALVVSRSCYIYYVRGSNANLPGERCGSDTGIFDSWRAGYHAEQPMRTQCGELLGDRFGNDLDLKCGADLYCRICGSEENLHGITERHAQQRLGKPRLLDRAISTRGHFTSSRPVPLPGFAWPERRR